MAFTFFRKYNKLILAVGGSLLMVIFLIPQAGGLFTPTRAEQQIGTIGDRQVIQRDRDMAARQIRILRTTLQAVAQSAQRQADSDDPQTARAADALMQYAQQFYGAVPSGSDADEQWMLMLVEADQQGAHATLQQANQLLANFGLSQEQIARFASTNEVDEAFFRKTFVDLLRAVRLQNAIQAPMRVNTTMMRHLLHRVGPRITLEALPVHASLLVDQVDLDDDQLDARVDALFEQYRSDEPGAGQPYGLGYRVPAEVRLEYIAVPLPSGALPADADDDARAEYVQQRAAFYVEQLEDAEFAEQARRYLARQQLMDDAGEEALPPSQQQIIEAAADVDLPERLSAELSPFVDLRYRRQRARDQQRDIVGDIVDALEQQFEAGNIQVDPETGQYAPGADFQPIALRQAEQQMLDRYGRGLDLRVHPPVALDATPELFREAQLPVAATASPTGEGFYIPVEAYARSVEKLGLVDQVFTQIVQAFAEQWGSQLGFPPELGDQLRQRAIQQVADDARRALRRHQLRVHVPSEPVVDPLETRYVFRLTQAIPAHAPASVDEVPGGRERLEADARLVAAYELVRQRAEAAYLAPARADFDALDEQLDNVSPVVIGPFSRRTIGPGDLAVPPLPLLGAHQGIARARPIRSEHFVDRAFEIAQPVLDAADTDAVPQARRIGGVFVDRALTLFVVQVIDHEPAPVEMLTQPAGREQVAQLYRSLIQMAEPGAAQPFNLDELSRRTGYQRLGARRDAEQADEEGEGEGQEAGEDEGA